MKQWAASSAAMIVGIAVGVGIGFFVTKPKLNESRKTIDELLTQIETSKSESESALQKASVEIARSKSDLSRSQAQVSQLNTELVRLRTELAKAQNELKSQTAPVESAPTVSTPVNPAVAVPTPQRAGVATPSGPVAEYTIKDGDSLWKIAEQQLGNGMRYKEILLLNPNITEKQTLVVGTKLKLPTQKN